MLLVIVTVAAPAGAMPAAIPLPAWQPSSGSCRTSVNHVVLDGGGRGGQHGDSREQAAIGARDRPAHRVGVDRGVALVQDDAMEAVLG